MANTHELSQNSRPGSNGSTETERLTVRVRELELECEKLRAALTTCQSERDGYLQAIYEHARASREFEDVDIPSLEAISAGPFETIE